LSTTITNWVQLALLPQPSVAVQITVLVPFGYAPGALLTTVTLLEQLSVAVALPSTTPLALQAPGLVLVVTVAGQVMTGAVVSLTRIVWLQLALLPLLSVAVQVRTITLLQLDPGLDWLSLKFTTTLLSQLSVAVTVAAAGTWL
jgi:hypothetical protein